MSSPKEITPSLATPSPPATPPPQAASPPKRPAVEALENAVPAKRPRGRPRKIRPEETTAAAPSLNGVSKNNGDTQPAPGAEIVAAPPKRGRGRPRKIRPEELPQPEPSIDPVTGDTINAQPATSTGPAPAPRKRGRPRKIKPEELPPAEPVVDPVTGDTINAQPVLSTEPAPAPRKRGRPPKIKPEALPPPEPSIDPITGETINAQPAPSTEPAPVPRKRGRPRKIRPEETNQDGSAAPNPDIAVIPRKRGRPRKQPIEEATTPKMNTRTIGGPVTPSGRTLFQAAATPLWRRNDRSARKKSARALIDRVINGDNSDEDADDEIAREIYGSSDDEDEEVLPQATTADEPPPPVEAVTPTKRGRGRPRKSESLQMRKKSPTPPRDLPPHELYFAQNRTGSSKTSHNTLASLSLLTHEEYFSILHEYQDRHAEDSEFLQSIHAESFPQWAFEAAQGFSVCAYGYGSKRPLLHRFAKFLYNSTTNHDTARIVIVNGYVRNTSIRDILSTVASAVDPAFKLPAGNPAALLDSVKTLLAARETEITIILNSIDAMPLRRPNFQPMLAHLAALKNVRLVCSADTPDFQLLWDSGLRSSFNFVFHDCTTFAPFTAEMDVVDDVHELLGRKARRVGGKEGVTYVLRSLPENAKNLFKLLVGEVLMAIDDEGTTGGENPGVEYRMVYSKAVEEFICSSEMAFRTLLKEFHDHQIITSRKDVLGTELLSLPFRQEELEAILEELVT